MIVKQIQAAEGLGEGIGSGQGNFAQFSSIFNADGSISWDKLTVSIVNVLFFVAATACLIYLIWGGINVLTSGGDKGKLETGRNKMVFAAIGMVLVAGSYAIWNLVMKWLGIGALEIGF